MSVKDYDLNPDNNTQINGINIAEGCPPSGINNAIRQIMADVKADSDAQNEKASTPASGSNLGPVKVGDGLSMGEDGTLSLDLVDGVDSTSTTQAATANAVKIAYDKAISALNALPVGSLIPSFASSMPLCILANGAKVSRTTYDRLFALLGTKFGAGDGSTTFNLPDFRNKTFWGANGNLMRVFMSGLPELNGFINGIQGVAIVDKTGVFSSSHITEGYTYYSSVSSANRISIAFEASAYNSIYGKSTIVQPPAIAVNIFIKY